MTFPSKAEKIGNVNVEITQGDMTQLKVNAYLVPQFNACASYGGVGDAIKRAGAIDGLNDYDAYAREKGQLPFGHVHISEAGGSNAYFLLNTVSVDSGKEQEFQTVQDSVYHALKAAEKTGIKTIAAPAMGTGIIGDLTAEQSAKAMLSGINRFAQEGGALEKISIVIYGDTRAYHAFSDILTNKAYVDVTPEVGEREFDFKRWTSGMKEAGVDVSALEKMKSFQDRLKKEDKDEHRGNSR